MFLLALALAAEPSDQEDDSTVNYSDAEEYYRRKYSGPCLGLHSFRNSDGLCECEADYPFGEPGSILGCFNCAESCHPFGACVHPGKCECQSRYSGDGITSCERIYPELRALAPSAGFIDENTRVNISYHYPVKSWLDRWNPECRFGDAVVGGVADSEELLHCTAPANPPGEVEVAIAFGDGFWSREAATFVYRKRFGVIVIGPMVAMYALAVAGLGVLLGFVCEKRKGRRKRGSEGRPLSGMNAGFRRKRKWGA
jgi:hypothetical protein